MDRSTSTARPGPPRTLAARAVAELQDLILAGDLAPGQRLRIEELADVLDMSPMPIREAIQRLETLGFAEHVPHRGARVRELSAIDLLDLYSVRIPLEGLAIRRAAMRFTADDAARGRAALDRYGSLHRAGDRSSAREAHLSFHLGLYEAARSPWLMRLIRPLPESAERYRLSTLHERGPLDALEREHEAILRSCVDRDPERAATLLREHLLRTVRLLLPEVVLGEDGSVADDVLAGLADQALPTGPAAPA